MTTEELIASGNLEMYVCGALSESELPEVREALGTSGEVLKEVERIENSLIILAENVAPTLSEKVKTYILNAIRKVKTLESSQRSAINWAAITGWAAAVIFLGGILWMLKQNSDLTQTIQVTNTENTVLRENSQKTEEKLAQNEQIMEVLRSKDYQSYTLPGNQAVAPQAFAKVFLNKKENIAYIDIKGLPAPPRGKVYQVWSLKMQPLTPTSMGLIESPNEVADGLYRFTNFPAAEAFGITLEPDGGSKTPTMKQLYILGKVPI